MRASCLPKGPERIGRPGLFVPRLRLPCPRLGPMPAFSGGRGSVGAWAVRGVAREDSGHNRASAAGGQRLLLRSTRGSFLARWSRNHRRKACVALRRLSSFRATRRCFAAGDGWQKSFATRPSLRARKNFSQSSACRLSECGSGPRALSGPRASWASRAARTSKPSRVPGGGELAIEGVLQHQVLDDIVFVDAELFGLFRYLLVDQWRTHKSRTDHTGADITARSFFDDHAA